MHLPEGGEAHTKLAISITLNFLTWITIET